MSSPRAERRVKHSRLMELLIKLVVLREQTGLILCQTGFRVQSRIFLLSLSSSASEDIQGVREGERGNERRRAGEAMPVDKG
jgi:hypothetical protein